MIEFSGKYTNAKVMIDEIDGTTTAQIIGFINHLAFTNPIAIMPDTHAGKGAVIGFTMEMTDKVIPNVIGVDIGCRMWSSYLGKRLFEAVDRKTLDAAIRNVVPFGTNVRKTVSKHFHMNDFLFVINQRVSKFRKEFNDRFGVTEPFITFDEDELKNMCRIIGMDYDRMLKSIGTVGGGNHFIEFGKSESGEYVMTLHCGSRNFGKCVAEFWQKQAVHNMSAPTVSKEEYVQWVKNTFPKKKYQEEIAKYHELYGKTYVEKGTEYLVGSDMYMYLIHMIIAQTYAEFNQQTIREEILEAMDDLGIVWEDNDQIQTVHNFIDFDDWTIRKGAIRSYENEKMVIPFNMEDGLLICEGKSNPEWNCSAPHGAGRLFSRSDAKRKLSLKDAKKSMKDKDIYTSGVPHDEVKEAYKDPEIIEICIEPTATIVDRVKPVMNMKDKGKSK